MELAYLLLAWVEEEAESFPLLEEQVSQLEEVELVSLMAEEEQVFQRLVLEEVVGEFCLRMEKQFYLQEAEVFYQLVERLFSVLQLLWVEFAPFYLQLVAE